MVTWPFLQVALAGLRPGGRAAVVVPAGLLGNSSLERFRKRAFRGYAVDAVLALPEGLYTTTGIGLAVLCFSHRSPHDDVWFVKASVVESALGDERALAALARGVAYRRGDVSLDALRSSSRRPRAYPTGTLGHLHLKRWGVPESEKQAMRSWSRVSSVVADALLPGGLYDEALRPEPCRWGGVARAGRLAPRARGAHGRSPNRSSRASRATRYCALRSSRRCR